MTDPVDYTLVEGASAPAFSMDGGTLFFLRGAGTATVWALDLASGSARRLLDTDEKASLLRRAPGDDRLVYAVDAGGDERHQLWLWEEGKARPLTAAPDVIHGFGGWSPDGRRITLTANDRDQAHFDLVAIDVAAGTRTRLAEGVHEGVAGGWSADGTRVLFTQDRSTGDQRPFVVPVGGAAVPVPRRGSMRFGSLRWDAAALLGLVERDGFMALCRIDPDTGAVETEYAPPGRDVEGWSLSPAAAGGLLATVENDRGFSVLRVGARAGERQVVGVPDGVVSDLAWSADGRLAFALAGVTRPSALFVWADGVARAVWEPPCDVPTRPFRLVAWQSFDAKTIPGWFAIPEGRAPHGGWPSIVWVHGGPAAQVRPTFRADMQALVAQGYAVLMPNVRGSTGYGRPTMDADDVEKRLDAVQDLAAAHAWLVRQPGIDAARVAVMGQSYGGYMVLAAVTEFPDLWRCAIDFYGISDFTTLLAGTGPWRTAHRSAEYGDPVRHRALFDRISPLRHVARIAVPMLVLHGIRDPRVGIGESEQLVAALRRLGRTVDYEVFDYAGHGFVRPDDRARVFRAVGAFLGRHL